MSAILQAGLRIPEDIAIMGCGNTVRPFLTDRYPLSIKAPWKSDDRPAISRCLGYKPKHNLNRERFCSSAVSLPGSRPTGNLCQDVFLHDPFASPQKTFD